VQQGLQIDWVYHALEGGTILIECSSKLISVCDTAKMVVSIILASPCIKPNFASVVVPILNHITNSSVTIIMWRFDIRRRKDEITVCMDIQKLHPLWSSPHFVWVQLLLSCREDGFGILNNCFYFWLTARRYTMVGF